ncbi:thiamine pyrophosphate-dependent enzyme [Phyllobacterium sp. YR531]|uniref:thiamine pyrophosphate-dependent enzyme n=1 Tax=Phyllobacterium sp. YR531 TaxID=1144343 RepID=UPI0032975673
MHRATDDATIGQRYALDRLFELTRDHRPYIAADMNLHSGGPARFIDSDRWIVPSGFGTMGYGLPAAIGMQIAYPENLVIDIADASSVQTTMKELSTAIQYDAPIKVFILNNGRMGFDGHSYSNALPDFLKLAEAFGAVGIRCDEPDDLDEAIGEMLAIRRPVLFDCRIGNHLMT